jgi:hypothetical protein
MILLHSEISNAAVPIPTLQRRPRIPACNISITGNHAWTRVESSFHVSDIIGTDMLFVPFKVACSLLLCFIEELPKDTSVFGKASSPLDAHP